EHLGCGGEAPGHPVADAERPARRPQARRPRGPLRLPPLPRLEIDRPFRVATRNRPSVSSRVAEIDGTFWLLEALDDVPAVGALAGVPGGHPDAADLEDEAHIAEG